MNKLDGYLTIKNYKEPLMAVKKKDGFGYYGAITCSVDNNYIQCHYCGKLFEALNSHIRAKHQVGVQEYREEFQLANDTALVSERYRQVLKQNYLDKLATMTDEQRAELVEQQKKRLKEWIAQKNTPEYKQKMSHPISLEIKNKRGTCPQQLLDKIVKAKRELGHVPSLKDFVDYCGSQRFKHLIFKTYGSWEKALKILKLDPKPNKGHTGKQKTYSDEELLEYLTIYAQENNKVPTATDFRRGLLPPFDLYTRRFKSIENARTLARVYDIVDRDTMRGVKKFV